MYTHLGVGAVIVAAIIAVTRMTAHVTALIAHALDTDQRWCHFRNFCLFGEPRYRDLP